MSPWQCFRLSIYSIWKSVARKREEKQELWEEWEIPIWSEEREGCRKKKGEIDVSRNAKPTRDHKRAGHGHASPIIFLICENFRVGSTSQLFFPDMREFSSFIIITKNTAILPVSLMHQTRTQCSALAKRTGWVVHVDGTEAGGLYGNTGKVKWQSWESPWSGPAPWQAGPKSPRVLLGFSTQPVLSWTLALETTAGPGSVISGGSLAPPPKTLFKNILTVNVSCKGDE